MTTVDLNCDMGESYGRYKLGYDEEILAYITSANIACGFHAGDPVVMDTTVSLAAGKGVAVGAHPSFPDLQGFGRRPMVMPPAELKLFLLYQIGAMKTFAEFHGLKMQHVKLHGALNNMACVEAETARAVAECVAAIDRDLIIVAMYNSQMYLAAEEAGLKVAAEFFADRNYGTDGYLLPRSHPAALIKDGAVALARCLQAVKEGKIAAVDGTIINVLADTICLHGDEPDALDFARLIRKGLENAGVSVAPMAEFL